MWQKKPGHMTKSECPGFIAKIKVTGEEGAAIYGI